MRKLFPVLMGRILFFSIDVSLLIHILILQAIICLCRVPVFYKQKEPCDSKNLYYMAYLSTIAHFLLYHKALFIVNMILVFFIFFLTFFSRYVISSAILSFFLLNSIFFSEITSISYLHKDRSAHDKPGHTAQYPQFRHTHPVYEPVQDFPAHKTYNSDFPKDLPQLLCLYNP